MGTLYELSDYDHHLLKTLKKISRLSNSKLSDFLGITPKKLGEILSRKRMQLKCEQWERFKQLAELKGLMDGYIERKDHKIIDEKLTRKISKLNYNQKFALDQLIASFIIE